MSVGGYEIFHFVTDALLFVTLVASICFTICAMVRLHRRRDPARRVFSWVKIAWLMCTIAVFTSLLEIATATVTSRFYQNSLYFVNGDDSVDLVARLSSGASALAVLFNVFAEVLIYLTLASMIRCIRLVSPKDEKRVRLHKWSRYATYGISFTITILSLAVFSVALYYVVLTEISATSSGIAWDRLYNNYMTSAAFMSIICLSTLAALAVAMLIRACVLKRKLRAIKSLRKPLRYLIACCSLWVLRAVFDIYAVVFDVVVPGFFLAPTLNTSSFNEVLSVVFKTWPVFIILVVLYYLGLDKKTGLSSTVSPLLTQDVESQAASSEFLSSEQPTVTPMTERDNAPVLTPLTQQAESLFAWDGDVDAPPEYSPPADQQVGVSAPSSTLAPIIRRPLPPSAAHLAEGAGRQSDEVSDAFADPYEDSMQRPTAASIDSARQLQPVATRSSSEENDLHLTTTHATDDDSLGLYHQADGRAPEAESSRPLPSHDEAMGLYHQADGRPPRSSPIDSETLPSHEETMGLYHQADGRPPGTSAAVLPDETNVALFQPSLDGPAAMATPPSHDEAMGLYHQADGRVPESEVVPYPEKDKKEKR
ncbi:hypothetical protein NLG97_g5116 [Lecanicillium saksenae]|uniref:Uncharacterized protein n=1 Tax=Lecanicillium saksenae TaxID=468837 RepID=A0ACC1QX75_9HYPO|nr:hypothetical protein NLG97_g5116 [Lecanicillium saksenae]